ncbi:hypothetical protein TWF481_012272 [Arthrobotrys musiformis]|uniref:BTB domain-containing protein n=1 Tax=Arthrobotrys musiformis TaxID=47236 RepID=A0AAV9VYM6_9PEZI
MVATAAQEIKAEDVPKEGGETVEERKTELCARCKEPLPLWAPGGASDTDPNFTRPIAAATVNSNSSNSNDIPDTSTGASSVRQSTPITWPISPVSDLIIHLPTPSASHRYLVSSQILRVVSPVWRRHLDPASPFQSLSTSIETISNRPHTVMTLYDDDPDTLLSVLNILHFSTSNIPTTTIHFEQLRSFAVLCDKYDCIHVLSPYSKVWLDVWAPVVLEPGYEDWLFIAKVFGDQRNVKELEKLLVEEGSSLSVCETYFLRSGRAVETTLIPEIALKRIMETRAAELTRQISIWRKFLQTFIPENVTKGCSNWDCVTLSYGNLIRSVEQSGLVKVFNLLEEWHGNIKDFEEKTGAIQLANGTRFHGYGWCPVENLNVGLRIRLGRTNSS